VLVWGEAADAESGAREVVIRAKEATVGIPSETRQAFRDGTNGFERILPGPDRMYPDTDLPPKRITIERLDAIRATLPPFYWEREAWFRTLGIPEDTVAPLAISPLAPLFEKMVKERGLNPTLAAVTLVQRVKALRREGVNGDRLTPEGLETLLGACASGRVEQEGVLPAMRVLARTGRLDDSDFPLPANEAEVSGSVARGLDMKERVGHKEPPKRFKAAMGAAMRPLRGRANGARVAALLREGMGAESSPQRAQRTPRKRSKRQN